MFYGCHSKNLPQNRRLRMAERKPLPTTWLATFQKVKVLEWPTTMIHSPAGWPCSSQVPDAAQIVEPQKPGSASDSPNTQKTCVAWNVFKKEVIKRQQQSDIQRRPTCFGIAAPAKTHRPPHKTANRLRDFCPCWSTGSQPSMLTMDVIP